MPDDENTIKIPNRAVSLTVVGSGEINENWDAAEKGLNDTYELAVQVDEKIPLAEKAVANGVATLDVQSKLNVDQLPEVAKGHVYEVSSLIAQLSLQAYPGDICRRTDIARTYALRGEDPSQFENWTEIASQEAGGEVGGNPPYTNTFDTNYWQGPDSDGNYTITYTSEEHGQGDNDFIFVTVKNNLGESTQTDYVVEQDGTVTLYADVVFNGSVIISNLQGNSGNTLFVPYSINSGPRDTNGNPNIFSIGATELVLVTSPKIVLLDGLGYVRTIESANNTDLTDVTDGYYYVFIDSINIEDNHLSSLTLISESNYLGIQDFKPTTGSNGQRCYVAFDRAYEYSDGWKDKACTLIGKIQVSSGILTAAYTFPFNENGINTNYKSSDKDYLFGDKVQGLDYIYVNNSTIAITPGKCLDSTQKRILLSTQQLSKSMNDWMVGTGNGGLITADEPQLSTTVYTVTKPGEGEEVVTGYTDEPGEADAYVVAGTTIYSDTNLDEEIEEATENQWTYTGDSQVVTRTEDANVWYNFFLIGDEFGNTDACISRSTIPTLPAGYTYYRKVASVQGYNKQLTQTFKYQDDYYFNVPIQVLNGTTSTELTSLTVDVPETSVGLILNVKLDEAQQVQLSVQNGPMVYSANSVEFTANVPSALAAVKCNNATGNITIDLLGYKDSTDL